MVLWVPTENSIPLTINLLPLGYFPAKGGVINLTRAMATELGIFGVINNCISPG